MHRTLKGSSAGIGLMASALLLSGCAYDTVEAAEVCASRTDPPIRAEWVICEKDPVRYGTYSWQLPQTSYDEDGYASFNSIVVAGVGQPLPRSGVPGAGGFGPARVSDPAKVSRVPANTSTISRGGLGVSGYAGSGGS